MKKKSNQKYFFHLKTTYIVCIFILLTTPSIAEMYSLKSMWPQNDQQWYFNEPKYLCMDKNNYVYVSDQWNHQVKKYYPDGRFVLAFGGKGTEIGEFNRPMGIAYTDGYIFVVDSNNDRIQKFTTSGQFICQWGTHGTAVGCFDAPQGIAINDMGQIFIADTGNFRIQQFSLKGKFIQEWGEMGNSPGNFQYPLGIAVDLDGYVYVSDPVLIQIQKFLIDQDSGRVSWVNSIQNWSIYNLPYMITFDQQNNMYVSTSGNYIEQFNVNNEFQLFWGNTGNQAGEFRFPWGILAGQEQTIYVADSLNNRIQTFSTSGDFIAQWSHAGTESAFFDQPEGVAAGSNNRIYIADQNNHRIKIVTLDGHFVHQWGMAGKNAGDFRYPDDIAIDNENYVYVADSGNNRIQKFSPTGTFVTSFGSWGIQDGQFETIDAIKIHPAEQIWVLDYSDTWDIDSEGNIIFKQMNRMQVFSSEGDLSAIWHNPNINSAADRLLCFNFLDEYHLVALSAANILQTYLITTEDNTLILEKVQERKAIELDNPTDIAVYNGLIYVTDSGQNCIQTFTSDGHFLTSFACPGTRPGDLQSPNDIFVDSSGNIYVTDQNRVQVFQKNDMQAIQKAIIISSDWAFSDNQTMASIDMSADAACHALRNRGYTSGDILYLRSHSSSAIEMQAAMLEFAQNASNVIIFMIGQGDEDTFFLNAWDYISYEQMKALLAGMTAEKMTLIADFDGAGSYLKKCSQNKLVTIASAQINEKLYFSDEKAFFFSQYFWNAIFHGETITQAFVVTQQNLNATINYQHPAVDANGNGIFNETEDMLLIQTLDMGNTISIPTRPNISQLTASITNEGLTVQVNVDAYTQVSQLKISILQDFPPYDIMDIQAFQMIPNVYYANTSSINTYGGYTITAFALHQTGLYSMPKSIYIKNGTSPDSYEGDNSAEDARFIYFNNDSQYHAFHTRGDMDWVQFHAVKDTLYTIETINLEGRCDTVIDIFDTDGITPVAEIDLGGIGDEEQLFWISQKTGLFFIRVRHNDPNIQGADTGYSLQISFSQPENTRHVTGKIINAITNEPIPDQTVRLGDQMTTLSDNNGRFDFLFQPSGSYTLTINNTDYQAYSRNMVVNNDAPLLDLGSIKLFNRIHNVNVVVQGEGSVYPSGLVKVLHGTSPIFYFEPEACNEITKIYLNNENITGLMMNHSIELPSSVMNQELKIVFSPIFYTISASSNTYGEIQPGGNIRVQCGDNQTFVMFPAFDQYYLKSVAVDQRPIASTESTFIFENIQSNHQINAEFAACYYKFLTNTILFPTSGGTNDLTIESPSVCKRISPDVNASWITITGSINHTDTYDILFSVDENSDEIIRYASLTLGAQHTVIQQDALEPPTHTIQLAKGWNLVSVPFQITNTAFFPDASIVFRFENGGYQQAFEMYPGEGYWIKNEIQSAYHFTGKTEPGFSMELKEGWHLIGAPYTETSQFVSIPENAVSAAYVYKNNRYEYIHTLKNGQGFWVKIVEPCVLVLE